MYDFLCLTLSTKKQLATTQLGASQLLRRRAKHNVPGVWSCLQALDRGHSEDQ